MHHEKALYRMHFCFVGTWYSGTRKENILTFDYLLMGKQKKYDIR